MKGKLCFIKRKSKNLVSNYRSFREKNVSFFEDRERSNKNLWTFFRNAPSFFFFLPAFFEKTPVLSLTVSPTVSSSAPPYARTDTPLRIAHSASSKFLPSPFTFTRNSLIQCMLRVKERPFFCLRRWRKQGWNLHPQVAVFELLTVVWWRGEGKKRKTADARATRARWGRKWEAGALLRKVFR